MSLSYKGDVSFKEIYGATIQKNEFEVDVLTRTFEGRTSLLSGFLGTKLKYVPDETYPSMNLTEYTATELEGGMSRVVITYKGLIGPAPTPTVVDQTQLQSVQLTTNNPDDGYIDVQYYAPTSTYRYVLASYENSPKYSAVNSTFKMRPFNPRPSDYTGQLQYNKAEIITEFTVEQQGLIFAYTVTAAKILEPIYALIEVE